MKKQRSEAEWLAKTIHRIAEVWRSVGEGQPPKRTWEHAYDCERSLNTFTARRLLAALKRRGWTPPKPKKKGRGK